MRDPSRRDHIPYGGTQARAVLRGVGDGWGPDMRSLRWALLVALPAGALTFGSARAQQSVPEQYQPLYSLMQQEVSALGNYAQTLPAGPGGMIFGAELGVADGNRGPALLQASTLPAVELQLDRLKELGVQGVTVAVEYPYYTPADPNYQRYRQFYSAVAADVRARGMALDVEEGAAFAGTPFTPESASVYDGLTVDGLTAGEHQIAQDVIDDMAPDYFTIGRSEPSTEAALTRLKALNDPATFANFVNGVLAGLNRGSTLVGSGEGSWESPEFDARLARDTTVDFIDAHVYPLSQQSVANFEQSASIATQYGKQLVLDETWLYKLAPDEITTANPSNSAKAFQRDAYDFFAPLDQQYLQAITIIAESAGVRYFSPFWSGLFFAYAPFDPDLDAGGFTAVAQAQNQAEAQALQADSFSDTGLFYAELIAAASGGQ